MPLSASHITFASIIGISSFNNFREVKPKHTIKIIFIVDNNSNKCFLLQLYNKQYIQPINMSQQKLISVNDKTYKWPSKTAIVICLDGSEPGPKGYIDTAIRMGLMPFMKSMISKSTYEIGKCAMPSFTNVNNMSIVTGTTPDVHGICGNFFF